MNKREKENLIDIAEIAFEVLAYISAVVLLVLGFYGLFIFVMAIGAK